MVKLCMLAVWKQKKSEKMGEDAIGIRLCEAMDLSSFSFFTRGTIKEHLVFGARTVVSRAEPGSRQTITLDDAPVLLHVYVRFDGLAGVVVSDKDYPPRVAFALISKTLESFETRVGEKWKLVATDQDLAPPFLVEDLKTFQDPKADKLQAIQVHLDEIKDIMHQNIDMVLERGESLDSLMEKSNDLSDSSKQFYKRAKQTNGCCRSW